MSSQNDLVIRTFIRIWWFPIMVGILVLMGSIFVLVPQISRLVEGISILNKNQKSIMQAQSKIDFVSGLNSDQINNQINVATLALPDHKPYYEVMAMIQDMAQAAGVKTGDFDLTPGSLATKAAQVKNTSSEGYVTLSTSLSVSGPSDRVLQFVERLQQSLPLVSVTSITISQETKGNDEKQRQATLDILIHYAPQTSVMEIAGFEPLPTMSEMQKTMLTTLSGYAVAQEDAASQAGAVVDVNRTDMFSY